MPLGGGVSLALGLGSSLFGGLFGSNTAKKAAKIQADAAQGAADQINKSTEGFQADISGANQTGQEYIGAGTEQADATLNDAQRQQLEQYAPLLKLIGQDGQLQQLLGPDGPLNQKFSFNSSDLPDDPGYQFTLKQGQDAIARSAAARGGLYSSGTAKSLAGYTTGSANQYFNDAYNRASSTFQTNRSTALSRIGGLQTLAGSQLGLADKQSGVIGTNQQQISKDQQAAAYAKADLNYRAASDSGNASVRGAQLAGDYRTQKSNAQAAGTVQEGNAWTSALNGGTASILKFLAGKYPSGSASGSGNGDGGD